MTGVLAPLTYVLAFVGVVILVQSVSGLLFAGRDRTRRVNRRLTMLDAGMSQDRVYTDLVRRPPAPRLAGQRMAELYTMLDSVCRQAGMRQTPVQLLGIAAAAAGALWLVGLTFASGRGGVTFGGVVTMLVGALILSVIGAWAWVSRKRAQRLKQISEQLPMALDVIVRAIRAGHPVVAAVQLAANELSDPLGSEFGLIVDETNYGAEFREALTNFARRTGSDDAHYFAVAVSIQAETGGNLAEVLDGLSRVMRGRATLAKRIKALASEGKASAYLISALPLFTIGSLMTFNPTFYTQKFGDPIFWPTAAVVMLLYFCGWLMIRRIVNFRY